MVGNHPHLTEEELKEFQELFDLVDLDHGGSISPEELGSLMETLGLKPSQARCLACSRDEFTALV
jgi:Ca2+-binding EF-hand superfamily protein